MAVLKGGKKVGGAGQAAGGWWDERQLRGAGLQATIPTAPRLPCPVPPASCQVACGSTSGVIGIWSWGYWADCSDRFPGGRAGGVV